MTTVVGGDSWMLEMFLHRPLRRHVPRAAGTLGGASPPKLQHLHNMSMDRSTPPSWVCRRGDALEGCRGRQEGQARRACPRQAAEET